MIYIDNKLLYNVILLDEPIAPVSDCEVSDGGHARQVYSATRPKKADETVFSYFFEAGSKSRLSPTEYYLNDPECKGDPSVEGFITISGVCRNSKSTKKLYVPSV